MTNELPGDEPRSPNDPSSSAPSSSTTDTPPPTPRVADTSAPVAATTPFAEPTASATDALVDPPAQTSAIAVSEPALSEDELRFRAMRDEMIAPSPPKKPHTATLERVRRPFVASTPAASDGCIHFHATPLSAPR